MRPSSLTPRRLSSSQHNDPAQYVLPFLVGVERTSREGEPDRGYVGESGETPAAKACVEEKTRAAPEPARNSTSRHARPKPVSQPHRNAKAPIPAAKKSPTTLTSAEVISVSANIIALVEKRSGAWSAPELAELLGCTGKHIYALAKSGRLPHLRIGGMVRFDPAATAEWLRNRFVAA